MRQYLLSYLLSKPLGVTSKLLILLCYACRRGLGECIHDRCEYCYLMVNLRWLLNTHLGGLRHLGHQVLPLFLEIPGYHVILLWTATQAQRDHKIIHARNFRVQPQAIMGSSIVEYVARPDSVVC